MFNGQSESAVIFMLFVGAEMRAVLRVASSTASRNSQKLTYIIHIVFTIRLRSICLYNLEEFRELRHCTLVHLLIQKSRAHRASDMCVFSKPAQ
jgi:hypothetical protein